MNIIIGNKKLNLAVIVFAAFVAFSCNKIFPDDSNKLRDNYPPPGGASVQKKVLYLILDGAEGREVDTIAPVNMTGMLKNAVYTTLALSGTDSRDSLIPASWANMMTGAFSSKTRVVAGFDSANFAGYPSLVTRFKTERPQTRTVAFAADKLFSDNLLKDATVNTVSQNNDQQVASNIVNALNTDSASLFIGQFNSIAKAGDAYGYTNRAQQYADAVRAVDGYVGATLAAIRARKGYVNEDWLIIVASNINGNLNQGKKGADSASLYDDTRRNSFAIFYNKRFSPTKYWPTAPPPTLNFANYTDSALLYRGFSTKNAINWSSGARVELPNTNGIYNINQGDSLTIQFKIKILNPSQVGQSPDVGAGHWCFPLVTSCNNNNSTYKGICFAFDLGNKNGDVLTNIVGDTTSSVASGNRVSAGSVYPKDVLWHNMTLTVAWPAGSPIQHTFYFDGAQRAQKSYKPGGTSIVSPNPLTIGYPAWAFSSMSPGVDFMISDFRYWKTFMTPAQVASYSCRTNIGPNDPLYPFLVTDLKLNDGNGATIAKDRSSRHNDGKIFDYNNSKSWFSFSEPGPGVCPPPDQGYYKASIRGVDLPFEVYTWLGLIPAVSWNLDGKYWSTPYTDVVP
ncbi:MAG: hypothetical protein J7539_07615 [Niabella sp.]|nr:hypothetical protein [Niabella sp.]